MTSSKGTENQKAKFREAARALECDDSEERFDDALRKVAKAKLKDDSPKPSNAKRSASKRKAS